MNKKGGARAGAGRKSKAEEQELLESLNPLHSKAMESLKYGLDSGDFRFVKLFMQYFYGSPKQMVQLVKPQEKNFPTWFNVCTDEELEIVDNIVTKNS